MAELNLILLVSFVYLILSAVLLIKTQKNGKTLKDLFKKFGWITIKDLLITLVFVFFLLDF